MIHRVLALLVGLCASCALAACATMPPPTCDGEITEQECRVYCHGFDSSFLLSGDHEVECGDLTCDVGEPCCECSE